MKGGREGGREGRGNDLVQEERTMEKENIGRERVWPNASISAYLQVFFSRWPLSQASKLMVVLSGSQDMKLLVRLSSS